MKRGINRPNLPFGGETPKLPLHRVDPGEIDRDVVVAAAFARHRFKTTAGEGCGRTSTAEMNDGSEILRLLQTRCREECVPVATDTRLSRRFPGGT